MIDISDPQAAAAKERELLPDDASNKQPDKHLAAKRIKALYGVMQSIEAQLGGGEGVEGLYGSIKLGGMQRVLAAMKAECNLDANSCLVDVGAGLGRPLMHALMAYDIDLAFGVEIDAIKCQKAEAFLRQTHAKLCKRGVVPANMPLPPITCAAIEQVTTLTPATHAYSFWEGVPTEGRLAFGHLFAMSSTLQAVAVVQRAVRGEKPTEMMSQLGFGGLLLTDSFPVSMSGSGRSFRAYVFKRDEQQQQQHQSTAAEKRPSIAGEQLPTARLTEGAMTHADLVNMQLRRIGVYDRLSAEDPRLCAHEGAARKPDNARSARRAARSASIAASGSQNKSSEVTTKAVIPKDPNMGNSSTAEKPATAASQNPLGKSTRAHRAAFRQHSATLQAGGDVQGAEMLRKTSPDANLESVPKLSTVSHAALCSPKKGIAPSSPLKAKRSPLKSNGSPIKAKGSSLKLLASVHSSAQRELWGHVRKVTHPVATV